MSIYNVRIGYIADINGHPAEIPQERMFQAKDDDEAVQIAVTHAQTYLKGGTDQYERELKSLAYVEVYHVEFYPPENGELRIPHIYNNQFFFWQVDKAFKPTPEGLKLEPIDEFLVRWLQAEKKSEVNCH